MRANSRAFPSALAILAPELPHSSTRAQAEQTNSQDVRGGRRDRVRAFKRHVSISMKTPKAFALGMIASSLLVCPMMAQTTQFVGATSDPVNGNLRLRSGTVPPQPGVELFVFDPLGSPTPGDPPYGTKYTLTFKTSEQPASVVAIPGKVLSYAYSTGTSGDPTFPDELVIEFTHGPYAGGVEAELPGPPSDFSIAIIPADGTGIPASLRGSYMATNISPLAWKLIPPSGASISFGFEITGNNGQVAFFDLFVPDSLIADWSAWLGRALTREDLALFSNNEQASTRFARVEGANPGALIEIQLSFNPTSNLVLDLIEPDSSQPEPASAKSFARPKALPPLAKVKKRLTVGEAPVLSLLATSRVVPYRRKVTLYGWARYGAPGEIIKITQQSRIATRGPKRAVIKKLHLDADGKFVTSIKMLKTDKFKASHVSAGGIASTTRPLRITVRGGGRN
jgi:hypothetical protein